jgi:hypothetical protein
VLSRSAQALLLICPVTAKRRMTLTTGTHTINAQSLLTYPEGERKEPIKLWCTFSCASAMSDGSEEDECVWSLSARAAIGASFDVLSQLAGPVKDVENVSRAFAARW